MSIVLEIIRTKLRNQGKIHPNALRFTCQKAMMQMPSPNRQSSAVRAHADLETDAVGRSILLLRSGAYLARYGISNLKVYLFTKFTFFPQNHWKSDLVSHAVLALNYLGLSFFICEYNTCSYI